MFGKSVLLNVLAAAAILSAAMVGAPAAFGADTRVTKGEVVDKGDEWITVRDEKGGQQTFSAQNIGNGKFDANAMEAIRKAPLRSTVSVTWENARRSKVLAALTVLAPPSKKPNTNDGTFVGVIKERSATFITVQGGDGDPVKFVVHTTRKDRRAKPEPDAEMLAAISTRKVGDRIFVKWDLDRTDNQAMFELRLAKSTEKTTYPKRDAKAAEAGAVVPETGVVVGTVDEKNETSITIKSGDKVEKYIAQMLPGENGKPSRLDPDIVRIIGNVGMDATLQINWVMQDKVKRISAIKTVPRGTSQPITDSPKPAATDTSKTMGTAKPAADFKDGDQGTLTGRVLERSSTSVQILTDEATPRKLTFAPKWIGKGPDEGGGLDQTMQKTMGNLKVGQKVKVNWGYQEKLRAESITGGGSAKTTETPKSGNGKSGVYTGKVIQKGETWILVRTDGENSKEIKFAPKWQGQGSGQGGAFDKDMIAAIRAIAVGSSVQVQWEDDGKHISVVKLTKVDPQ